MSQIDTDEQVKSVREIARDVIRMMEKNYEESFSLDDGEEGLSIHEVLDNFLTPGNVACVVAEPGVGSTALLLRFLMSLDLSREGVILYSPRDTNDDLFLRMIGFMSGRDTIRLAEGRLFESEWDVLIKRAGFLADSCLQIRHRLPQDLGQVRKAIEGFPQVKGPLRLVIFDDLLIDGSAEEAVDQCIETLLRDLEGLAIDCKVAIIFTWKTGPRVDGEVKPELRPSQVALHQKCQQFLRIVMTLCNDGQRHRLSLYDTDTGRNFAMRLTLLTGIGVMHDA